MNAPDSNSVPTKEAARVAEERLELVQRLFLEYLDHYSVDGDPRGAAAVLTEIVRQNHPAALLADPVAVHLNMLRGVIAKPSIENIIHLYGEAELRAALAARVNQEELPHKKFRLEALALAATMDGSDFAGDLDAPGEGSAGDWARTLAIVVSAYGWTVDDRGRLIGLVAGDQGYAATGIVIGPETMAAISGSATIKPLEWLQFPEDGSILYEQGTKQKYRLRAVHGFGAYFILDRNDGSFSWKRSGTNHKEKANSLKDAKAAVQADFEERGRSVLSSSVLAAGGEAPIARAHVTMEDDGPYVDLEVLDGARLQPGMSPVLLYAAPVPARNEAVKPIGYLSEQGFDLMKMTNAGVRAIIQNTPDDAFDAPLYLAYPAEADRSELAQRLTACADYIDDMKTRVTDGKLTLMEEGAQKLFREAAAALAGEASLPDGAAERITPEQLRILRLFSDQFRSGAAGAEMDCDGAEALAKAIDAALGSLRGSQP